jgi:hypothetical protein
LTTNTLAESSTVRRAIPQWFLSPDGRRLAVIRFCVAAAASAALCLLIWSTMPRSLSGSIDIVGYPTYYNYDYASPFWAYRLVVYIFPFLTIILFALLSRRGPLRRRTGRAPTGPMRMVSPLSTRSATDEPTMSTPGALLRLALPLGVVLVAAGSRNGQIRGLAAACGVGYLLAVLAVGIAWSWRCGATGSRRAALLRGMAWANGVGGAAAAILGVWFVSRHTVVLVNGAGRHWPWMPLWLAAVGVGAMLCWVLQQIRIGRSGRAVERSLLTVVVGSVAVFLGTSALPGPVGVFHGDFDSGQTLAGASLTHRGYFPWRDLIFIHGLFPDVLKGTFGTAVFGDTIWGELAGGTVLLYPLCAVALYLYAVWVSSGNPWFLAVVSVFLVAGLYPIVDGRFILVPLTLVLLGEALRRRSGAWCVALVLVLFGQAVLVPETSFLAVPGLACVVAADVVHRDRNAGLWQAMRRTRWCMATGSIATVLLGVLLAWRGALRPFIDYYLVFGPGHNAAGTLPLDRYTTTSDHLLWGTGILAVLVTIWATAVRVHRRGTFEPQDWVAVAAAGFVAVYAEKALGRFDSSHVRQGFGVALPLILLWLWKAMRAGDVVIVHWPAVRWRAAIPFANAAAALLLVACVVTSYDSLALAARKVDQWHRLSVQSGPGHPRLGYAQPGRIDLALLRDLDLALRAHAGDDKPVFDMTNAPGYVYYLLGREPGTRFFHVSMAIPPYAQRLLIDELERSRPPVVIFHATRIGGAAWDGIPNNVRHYQVSEYVLDGWVPLMRTHGNLLLIRRDLVEQGLPAPSLAQPPVTTDLWFGGPQCDWGATPNFLTSVPNGASLRLPVRPLGTRTFVTLTGWAADPSTGRPARSVVVVAGQRVVASLTPSVERPDVARALGRVSSASGFSFSGVVDGEGTLAVYMLADDGMFHPLTGSARSDLLSVQLPDGRVVPTALPSTGSVSMTTSRRLVGQVDLPGGVDLARYDLATLSTEGDRLAKGKVVITDAVAQANHYISAVSLPASGSDMAVRVGSCLEWHGFSPSRPLYVVQDHGPAVTTVTLSGVRS